LCFFVAIVAVMNLYLEEGARCPHTRISGNGATAAMIFILYHMLVSFPS
jgi:hypothetical protein